MASSNVSSVTNHFSTANEGFTTTLNSTIAPGATTVPLNGTSGLIDGSVFVGIIEPSLPNQQTFTGVVNIGSSQISNVVWTRGTNTTHIAGVAIVDYVSGTGHNMMTKGILTHANQDGTLKGSALGTGTVATAALADGSVTAPKLASTAIALGYAQITADFSSSATTATEVAGLNTTVTIPTGGRRIKITAYFPAVSLNVTGANTSYVGIWDGAVGSGTLLNYAAHTSSANGDRDHMIAMAIVTPAPGSKTYRVSVYVDVLSSTFSSSTDGPAFILVEAI